MIDENGLTSVENLYVAGEAAGGIHGTNRLMGNSLLDIIVFGRRSGRDAAAKSRGITVPEGLNMEHLEAYHRELKQTGAADGRVGPILLPHYTHRQ